MCPFSFPVIHSINEYKEVTWWCYILNIKALDIVVSVKKIFMFPHNSLHVCKTCDRSGASFSCRVIISNKLSRGFLCGATY